jgi:hypothetical protein
LVADMSTRPWSICKMIPSQGLSSVSSSKSM